MRINVSALYERKFLSQIFKIKRGDCFNIRLVFYYNQVDYARGTCMTQEERRVFLINYLLKENPDCSTVQMPDDENGQKRLLRSLMNVRPPRHTSEEFFRIQDEYLREAIRERGITDLNDLKPFTAWGNAEVYVWRGDITRLKVDAIVNAANSAMTGCWQPCHLCIDNCIHTFAGVQLRALCADIMQKQGYEEPTGSAKITSAFNLPCKYVLHTVGPIVQGRLQKKHEEELASCYRSCLALAEQHKVRSIAFCCISTGVFMFPNRRAAEIAVEAVRTYCNETGSGMKIVFNVFKDEDFAIYSGILS